MNLNLLSDTGFGWVLLSVGLYGVLHSLLASHAAKRWAARRWGQPWVDRYYRLGYSLVAGPTFLPPLLLVYLLPDRTLWRIPLPWVILTVLAQLLAVTALLLAVSQSGALRFLGLEQALRPAPAPGQPPALVVNGFYAWVRHPLYLFGLIAIWLMPVMSANLLALNLGVSMYLLLGTVWEENKLLDEFGPAYADYRARVPRILPWPRSKPRGPSPS